jgi:DNA invertase Pin-like site-specific DNA recombinase
METAAMSSSGNGRKRTRRASKRDTNDMVDQRVGLYCRVSLDKDDTGKSTTDQAAIGREWAEKVGAVIVGEYIEKGSRSASRYATKDREEYTRLLSDIEDGKLDIVWFWEQSRASRRLVGFGELRDLCRDMGVLWVIRDRPVDPNDTTDMLAAGLGALISEQESEMTSQRVTRGKASSAQAGRRAGRIAYGYKALYASDGRYLHDVPDMFDGDGKPVENTPAYVVREIYDRILKGHSISSIRRDLADRGVRTKRGYRWQNSTIRNVATSPTYLGQRVYQVGEDTSQTDRVKHVLDGVETAWPPLVDAETWWAVHRILSDPKRYTSRPGRAVHLLSSVAVCGECAGKLARKKAPPRVRATHSHMYWCIDRACVGIYADVLDDYVEKVMVRWLSNPDTVADLTRVDDSAKSAQARADLEQLRADLTTLHRDARAGRVSPVIATESEAGIKERIEEAEQRIQDATLPPVLRGNIGAQAQSGWDDLDVGVKRQIIAAVADIRLHKVGRHGNRAVPVQARVSWRWLLGPNEGAEEGGGTDQTIRAHRDAEAERLVERREKVAHLRDAGWTREMIAEELKVSVHTVKKDITAARRNPEEVPNEPTAPSE